MRYVPDVQISPVREPKNDAGPVESEGRELIDPIIHEDAVSAAILPDRGG